MRRWAVALLLGCAAPPDDGTVDDTDVADTDAPDTDAPETDAVDTDLPFVADDVPLATGAVDDPEISPSGRMLWLDRFARELWVTDLDPISGAPVPADGRGARVDGDVAPFDRGENGGEWMLSDRGEEALYVKAVDDGWGLTAAAFDGEAWTPALLPGPLPAFAAYGSSVPDDPEPWVAVWATLAPVTMRTRPARAEGVPPALPAGAYFAAFVEGSHALVVLTGLGTTGALVVADPDAGTAEVVAEGVTWGPRAWGLVAPELGETVVVAEVREGPGLPRRLVAWRRTADAWERWAELSPPAEHPFLTNSAVFVHQGRTYAAFLAFEHGDRGFASPSVVRLVALDPERPLARTLSVEPGPDRRGLEVWSTGDRAFAYYLQGVGAAVQLRRCATGL